MHAVWKLSMQQIDPGGDAGRLSSHPDHEGAEWGLEVGREDVRVGPHLNAEQGSIAC